VPSPRTGNGPPVHRLVSALYWLAMTLAYTRPASNAKTLLPTIHVPRHSGKNVRDPQLLFSPNRPLIMSVPSFFASRITEFGQ